MGHPQPTEIITIKKCPTLPGIYGRNQYFIRNELSYSTIHYNKCLISPAWLCGTYATLHKNNGEFYVSEMSSQCAYTRGIDMFDQ